MLTWRHRTLAYISLSIFYYRLGEACSHVAAVLSCLIKATEARKKSGAEAFTSRRSAWLLPVQDVCYIIQWVSPAPVTEIKCIGPSARKKEQQGE